MAGIYYSRLYRYALPTLHQVYDLNNITISLGKSSGFTMSKKLTISYRNVYILGPI